MSATTGARAKRSVTSASLSICRFGYLLVPTRDPNPNSDPVLIDSHRFVRVLKGKRLELTRPKSKLIKMDVSPNDVSSDMCLMNQGLQQVESVTDHSDWGLLQKLWQFTKSFRKLCCIANNYLRCHHLLVRGKRPVTDRDIGGPWLVHWPWGQKLNEWVTGMCLHVICDCTLVVGSLLFINILCCLLHNFVMSNAGSYEAVSYRADTPNDKDYW